MNNNVNQYLSVKSQKLFCILNENRTKASLIEKAELYEKLFAQPYEKKRDYQIRHEIRVLSRHIERYLIDYNRTQQNEWKNDSEEMILLEIFLQKKQIELFEKYWRKFKRTAEKNKNYKSLFSLEKLYIQFLQEKSEFTFDFFELYQAKIKQAVQLKILETAEELKRLELQLIKSERRLKAFKPETTFSTAHEIIDLKKLKDQNPLLEYYELFAKQYQQFGEEKLNSLLQLTDIHPEITTLRPDTKADIITIKGTIALEYFLQQRYELADQQYQHIFEFSQVNKEELSLPLWYNYISNLVKLKRFKEAIELIIKQQPRIKKVYSLRFLFDFTLIICCLILKENEVAYRWLHTDTYQRPESQYYNFQLAYVIYFYQTEQDTLCESYINNLYKQISRKAPVESMYEKVIALFRRLFNAVYYQVNEDKLRSLLLAIRVDIFKVNQEIPDFSDTFFMIWLQKELEHLLKLKS